MKFYGAKRISEWNPLIEITTQCLKWSLKDVNDRIMIYLDHNATTPIAPEVAYAMHKYIYEEFGNPSSAHALGKWAKEAIEKAREQVARLVNAKPSEIIFTSGGTESNNTVIKGIAYALKDNGDHIITTCIEHPSILNPCLFLMHRGFKVTFVPVDEYGMVNPADIKKAINEKTVIISVMHANNETGTIQPISEIGSIAREAGVLFHTDAAQSVGKIETDVKTLNVDFLTIAGHKLYGPKGVGALYARDGTTIEPLLHGAGQEGGRRAGTESVILNVGLGEACALAFKHIRSGSLRIQSLRDSLHRLLDSAVDGLTLNGHPIMRLPNTLNISFPGISGAELLEEIPEICASTGAACHDRSIDLSHVLAAMNVPKEVGLGAIRLTLGRETSQAEIDRAAQLIIAKIRAKRKETKVAKSAR